MHAHPQTHQYIKLHEWFQSELGQVVSQEFSEVVSPFKSQLRGDTLIQLGAAGEHLWLNCFSYKHHWVAAPFSIPHQEEIQCALEYLPLARNSVDCVVVPLTLELFANHRMLLDEIDRILSPMGFVVFFCINPWSSWSVALKIRMLNCYAGKKAYLRTPTSLNRILTQRGYRQCALTHFCYLPPVNNKQRLERLKFLNQVGKMLWPFPSGLYCFIAQKYELIKPTLLAPAVTRLEPVNPSLSLGV